MGNFFIEGLPSTMESIYADSDKKTPIIFVLSQGADPSSMIFKFASDREMTDKLFPISLGQGQGEHASKMIEKGKEKGYWVLL
mmetsp:Transcript_28798/g.26020  ORF Transcript_28798/g.26020 Transcript_28798/m.26020 type:complete len:83 (-) Transcript_28798:320-568(-)